MFGCLVEKILNGIDLLLADNGRFSIVIDDTGHAIHSGQIS